MVKPKPGVQLDLNTNDYETLKQNVVHIWRDQSAEAEDCARSFLCEFLGRADDTGESLEELLAAAEKVGLLTPVALLVLERVSELLDSRTAMGVIDEFTKRRLEKRLRSPAGEKISTQAREGDNRSQGSDGSASPSFFQALSDCHSVVEPFRDEWNSGNGCVQAARENTIESKRLANELPHHAAKIKSGSEGSVNSILNDENQAWFPQVFEHKKMNTEIITFNNAKKDMSTDARRHRLAEFIVSHVEDKYVYYLAQVLRLNPSELEWVLRMLTSGDRACALRYTLMTYFCRAGAADVEQEILHALNDIGCRHVVKELGRWLRAECMLNYSNQQTNNGQVANHRAATTKTAHRQPHLKRTSQVSSKSVEELLAEVPSAHSLDLAKSHCRTFALEQRQADWREKVASWKVCLPSSSTSTHSSVYHSAEEFSPMYYQRQIKEEMDCDYQLLCYDPRDVWKGSALCDSTSERGC